MPRGTSERAGRPRSTSGSPRWLAGRVDRVGRVGRPVFIACDNEDVAEWADSVGAPRCAVEPGHRRPTAPWTPAGRRSPARASTTSSIAHSDLPWPTTSAGVPRPRHGDVVPERSGGTNVMALPVGRRAHAGYGGGSYTKPPRRWPSPRPPGRGPPRSLAGPRRRQACGPDPSHAPGRSPPVAANDPGQPTLTAGRRPRRRRTGRAGVGAGHRGPPRRRRVRRRRHAGQVGGRRVRCPSPRVHRRIEGHVGRRCRHAALVARRQDEQRAAARLLGERTARCVFLGRVDGELDERPRRRQPRSCADHPRLRPDVVLGHDPWKRYRLHPDHRSAGIVCDAIVGARDPHFFPSTPAHHRPSTLLFSKPTSPTTSRTSRGRRHEAGRAAGPRQSVRVDDEGHRRPASSTRSATRVRDPPRRARRRARHGGRRDLQGRRATSDGVLATERLKLNWPGARPAPGGPANAWAMEIQSVATSTETASTVSSTVTSLGDHQTEVEAPVHVRRRRHRAGPHVHVSPLGTEQLDTNRALGHHAAIRGVRKRTGGRRHRCERHDATDQWALVTRQSPSATSCPWAHVSIRHAVANNHAPIAGPYQGRCEPSDRGGAQYGHHRLTLDAPLVDGARGGGHGPTGGHRRIGPPGGEGELAPVGLECLLRRSPAITARWSKNHR